MPDTEDISVRRATLDAHLNVHLAELKRLLGQREALDLAIVKERVEVGGALEDRLAITPYGKQGEYVREIANRHGFESSKAHNNRDFAYLHREHGYTFTRLVNLRSVQAVHDEAVRLRGTAHADRLAEEHGPRRQANAIENGLLLRAILSQANLRDFATGLRQQDLAAWQEWIFDGVVRPRSELSPEERRRGLSKLMLDSGAYTLRHDDSPINPEEFFDSYCEWLERNPWVQVYVTLDHIDQNLTGESAYISMDRFQRMHDRGFTPIPVFHAGEPLRYLKRYLEEFGADYIGIGGVANSRSLYRNWAFFDKCFNVIAKHGRSVRTHVMGIARPDTLLQFPFDSADAASWLLQAQKFQSTNLSRLGGPNWRREYHFDHGVYDERYYRAMAATTFLEVLDAHRFEREVREKRPFDFFMVANTDNPWWLPAIHTVNHRNVLMSFAALDGHEATADLKLFIDDPLEALDRDPYGRKHELLLQAKARYSNMRVWAARRRREILSSHPR